MNYDFEFPIHFAAHGGNSIVFETKINELIFDILIYLFAGHEDIIKLLIKYDATVNVRNRFDWTPLFYAVLNGNERVVKLLVNHADEDFSLNDKDAQGKTVFHICAEKGNVRTVLSFVSIRK